MDLTILKKRIDTYRTKTGRVTNLPDELILEILHKWECWTGTSSSFYTEIGTNYKKMAKIMGKAKKLKREGHFFESEFKEVEVQVEGLCQNNPSSTGCNIELVWKDNIIRFGDHKLLINFLNDIEKKAA